MSTGPAVELNIHSLLSLPITEPPFAILFPGQGAQRVGMAQDVFERYASARDVFALADGTLGSNVSGLCFSGPEESLTDTANAQPAILTTSLAYLAAGIESGAITGRPSFLAGHSLGEYTALVAAGSLSPADALRLVQERGRLMAEAGRSTTGAMVAILGLDEDQVRALCEKSGAEPANFNGPTQTVVGGTPDAVEHAGAIARESGGKALPVKVSGAFHTSLMLEASGQFAAAVDSVTISPPRITVIGNASSAPLESPSDIADELKRQIARPVQWHQSMQHILAEGVQAFVEIGPGRALSAMLKRMDPQATCASIDSLESLSSDLHV
jgi:[acyl-carrier-protein] S-malonyltransferase